MESIELSQKSRIDVVVAKMAMEEETTSFKRYTCPKFQSIRIFKKVGVLLTEESNTITLASWHDIRC